VRGTPVVALVDEVNAVALFRDRFSDGKPVVKKAENTVENDQWLACFTYLFEIELHDVVEL